MQIRNWIYHTKQDSKYIKDGVISCTDVFERFAELFDEGSEEVQEENNKSLSFIFNQPICAIIHSKCKLCTSGPKTEENEYFDFEFNGSFNKKFKASLKTHQLVSKNKMLREATDYFFYKYITQILDDGEKIMNKCFTNKKNNEFPRPNVIFNISLIDLSCKTSAEDSNSKHKKKGVIFYTGTVQNTNRILEYFIKCIEELHLHISGKIDLSENLFSEVSEDFINLSEVKIDKFINFVSNKKKPKEKPQWNIFLPPFSILQDDKNNKSKYNNQQERTTYLTKKFKEEIGKRTSECEINRDYLELMIEKKLLMNTDSIDLRKESINKSDIRSKAAKEKLNTICLETELENNVKIINKEISNAEFFCQIKGSKKNVNAAKLYLEEKFNERLDRFKRQLLPLNLYRFAKEKKYFESECTKWKEFNVEMRYGLSDYRGTTSNFVEIIGSSKSVSKFYSEILKEKADSSGAQNDDGNCFNNTIEWPPHYLKCLDILGQETKKYKDVNSIDEFLDQSNFVESLIKEIEMINYPPEWENFKYHTSIKKLDSKSLEYKQIKDLFQMGKCKVHKIQKIERIMNPFLYNLYECKKREMLYKHFRNPDYEFPDIEMKLWHGTSTSSPLLPACQSDEGIDKRFMKITGDDNKGAVKYYGIGCYFATTAGYSDNQYSYCLREIKEANKDDLDYGHHQLMLCKVLVGSSDYGNIALELDQMRTLSQENLKSRIENRKIDQIGQNGVDLLSKLNNNKNEKSTVEKFEKELWKMKNEFIKNYSEKNKANSDIEFIFYSEREGLISSLNLMNKNAIQLRTKDLRFDSIMDDRFMITRLKGKEKIPSKPRMYVTFDNAQSYPAYIITYGKGKPTTS